MIQANLLVIYYLSVHQWLHPSIHFFCPFVHPATIQPFLQSSSHLTTTHFILSIYKIQIEHLLAVKLTLCIQNYSVNKVSSLWEEQPLQNLV